MRVLIVEDEADLGGRLLSKDTSRRRPHARRRRSA